MRQAIYQIVAVVGARRAVLASWSPTSPTTCSRQNIASGFGFLGRTAGFDVSQTPDRVFDASTTYGRAFLVGLLNTLLVAGLGIVLATIIGFVVGIARLSSNWLVARLATVYVEVIRNVPLLLQLFFWYFAVLKSLPAPRQSSRAARRRLPQRARALPAGAGAASPASAWSLAVLVGIVASIAVVFRWRAGAQTQTGQRLPVLWIVAGADRLAAARRLHRRRASRSASTIPSSRASTSRAAWCVQPEFIALLLGLSIYTASFIAEIVRAGILGVSKGQTEAALAIGLSQRPDRCAWSSSRRRMRIIIPPLTSQYPQPDQELVAGAWPSAIPISSACSPARCSTRPARRSR